MKPNKTIIIFLGVMTICMILHGCTNNSFFEKNIRSVNSSEISEYELYIIPDHIRGATSRVAYIQDIVQDDDYICEEDNYNYTIIKIENENKYLFVLYEKDDGIIVSSIYTEGFYNSNDFLEFNIGTHFSEIKKKLNIPENTNIDTANELYYYLDEGGYIVIKLDKNLNIEHIEKYNDEYCFMSILKKSNDFNISELYIEHR